MKYFVALILVIFAAPALGADVQPSWTWDDENPGGVMGGEWRGNPDTKGNCNSGGNFCTSHGEHRWFEATVGGTKGLCKKGKKAYCKNIASTYKQTKYVFKAPNCAPAGRTAIQVCPKTATGQPWALISWDKYGDGQKRCTGNTFTYLCGELNF